eukprot:TRINITY_DN26511_c0_g3_i1.p1 TRINITY_DN26511_c0_g3~~TRINITY_DN26511_c0_g3_i1.p1  ORF type:complete len:132 (-),score=37.67 TRINITY_DN26511_c0_g3_i1:94-489(-)
MKPFGNYYNCYKKVLKKFHATARAPETAHNSQKLEEHYKALWEVMCEFFASKEYLGAYNPVFLATGKWWKKDEILGKLFELERTDIEKDFYEILLHLLRKVILKEKYENLKKLQYVILLAKKWKDFSKHKH